MHPPQFSSLTLTASGSGVFGLGGEGVLALGVGGGDGSLTGDGVFGGVGGGVGDGVLILGSSTGPPKHYMGGKGHTCWLAASCSSIIVSILNYSY
jgi:hypothetical protein